MSVRYNEFVRSIGLRIYNAWMDGHSYPPHEVNFEQLTWVWNIASGGCRRVADVQADGLRHYERFKREGVHGRDRHLEVRAL